MSDIIINVTKNDISRGKFLTLSNRSRRLRTGIMTGSVMAYAISLIILPSPPGNQLITALTSIAICRTISRPSAKALTSSVKISKMGDASV